MISHNLIYHVYASAYTEYTYIYIDTVYVVVFNRYSIRSSYCSCLNIPINPRNFAHVKLEINGDYGTHATLEKDIGSQKLMKEKNESCRTLDPLQTTCG